MLDRISDGAMTAHRAPPRGAGAAARTHTASPRSTSESDRPRCPGGVGPTGPPSARHARPAILAARAPARSRRRRGSRRGVRPTTRKKRVSIIATGSFRMRLWHPRCPGAGAPARGRAAAGLSGLGSALRARAAGRPASRSPPQESSRPAAPRPAPAQTPRRWAEGWARVLRRRPTHGHVARRPMRSSRMLRSSPHARLRRRRQVNV